METVTHPTTEAEAKVMALPYGTNVRVESKGKVYFGVYVLCWLAMDTIAFSVRTPNGEAAFFPEFGDKITEAV